MEKKGKAISTGIEEKATQTKLQRYVSPTPGEIPIIAIGSPNKDKDNFSFSTLKLYKEIGINLVQNRFSDPNSLNSNVETTFTPSFYKMIDELMSNANAAGVRVVLRVRKDIVTDPEEYPDSSSEKLAEYTKWLQEWKKIAEKYYNNEALGCWMLLDEPVVNQIKRLAEVKNQIMTYDKWGHIVFTSLHSFKNFLEGAIIDDPLVTDFELSDVYRNYLKTYRDVYGPAVWNTTAYALTSWDAMSIQYGFFQTLELYRRLSYMTARPFWGYPRAIHDVAENQSLNNYKDKIASLYRLEAFSLLAFGAQGIGWWKMRADKGTWAPIDENDNVTVLFDKVKEVNEQIKKTQEIFLNCTVMECRFTHERTIHKHFEIGVKENKPFGSLTSVSGDIYWDSATKDRNSGFLMSLVKNRNRTYIVFVNVDIKHPDQTVKVKFNRNMRRLGLYGSEVSITKDTYYTLKVRSGDWAIFAIG